MVYAGGGQRVKPTERQLHPLKWRDRFTAFRATLVLFAIAVVFSLPALSGSGREISYLANLRRFASQFFPPDFSDAAAIFAALGETVQIAVMATLFATFISLPLSAAGAQNIAPRWLNIVVRMILNVTRTLPSLIWALLAVAIVGPNPLAGVVGLTFYSIGYLAKFFSDAFESVDASVADGLRSLGAGPMQAFQFGMLPQLKPMVASQVLWMLEYNIRSAAIVGYVGAGGLGLRLHTYQEFGQWNKFSAVLIFILVLVTALDLFGEWLRGRIMERREV